MNDCKKCAKQFLCSRKECKFLSWIYTKNYGEVHRVENTKKIKRKNNVFYLEKVYNNFIQYKNEKGWNECFSFQELGLLQQTVEPHRKIRGR